MFDRMGREIDYLRISITDRCNLRCIYCMPEDGIPDIQHTDILSYEEIVRIVRQAAELGIRHLRVTGGEPMARRGCLDLIRMLHAVPGIETISMTTNGLLLDGRVREACDAGLTAVNLSLDALDPELYRRITRGGDVTKVMRVLRDAAACGLSVKINAVPVRGLNEQELPGLAELARSSGVSVRFIELMPLGCGADLQPVPTEEIRERMEACFGTMQEDTKRRGYGPAYYLRPEGFQGSIGFISPLSHEFCGQCNRVRLTSDGQLKLCLNHSAGVDLRTLLRGGVEDAQLKEVLRTAIERKPERHGFNESVVDREKRRMNEIGG